jgi:116 kDa U5 small nuclear ribonucleoprotein component
MEENLYDEFGNYIGPEIVDDDGEEEEEERETVWMDEGEGESAGAAGSELVPMEEDNQKQRAVVLFEDKKFYPSAEEVYGDAETLVQDEDTQPLTEPIIAPVKEYHFYLEEKTVPNTTFQKVSVTFSISIFALSLIVISWLTGIPGCADRSPCTHT